MFDAGNRVYVFASFGSHHLLLALVVFVRLHAKEDTSGWALLQKSSIVSGSALPPDVRRWLRPADSSRTN